MFHDSANQNWKTYLILFSSLLWCCLKKLKKNIVEDFLVCVTHKLTNVFSTLLIIHDFYSVRKLIFVSFFLIVSLGKLKFCNFDLFQRVSFHDKGLMEKLNGRLNKRMGLKMKKNWCSLRTVPKTDQKTDNKLKVKLIIVNDNIQKEIDLKCSIVLIHYHKFPIFT